MPITMSTKGMAELEAMLKDLGDKASAAASAGLYEGAGVMADEIRKAADGINTQPFHYTVFGTREPSPEEKAIVQEGKMGVSKFKKNGAEVNTSVGYANAGYAMLAGKRKPIALIANAINSGTSFMTKQPFFRRGVNNGKDKAVERITKVVEERVDQMIKEHGG